MLRRLYFLFPDEHSTRRAVEDLVRAGVKENFMHAVGREGIKLASLPPATLRQRRDTLWVIERILWNSDLAVFGIALAGLILSLIGGFSIWSVAAIAVMFVAFIAGALYTNFVPNTHLDEFRGALGHGEVVLMVDVPKRRVLEIEDLVGHHHPGAIAGGTGWTINALGV